MICHPIHRWVFNATMGIAVAMVAAAAYAQSTQVLLDGNSPGRIFDGLGAASAGASSRLLIDYPEPQRSQILDYLFKPGYGAALQHLKVEIGADVNSTDGSEPSHMRSATDHDSTRGYEWWLMVEAHKRNPKIVLDILPWGGPGWVGATTNGKTTLYTPAMASYVADFIKTARKDYGLDIAYAGVWNEKVFDVAYVKELHRRFLAEHLTTRIVCCDEYSGQGTGQWAIADAILKDPELNAAIDVIGVHYPRGKDGTVTTTEAARQTGKPLWSSEDQPNDGGGPILHREWAIGGRILAHFYNQNYLQGSITSTDIWSPITSYYDNLAAPNSGLMYANTPWSGHYDVQSTIWVTAHTTQFAQPGWQYLQSASGLMPHHGSYVSLRSPDKKNWSIVLETIDATAAQTVSFRLAGGLVAPEVHIWETNGSRMFELVATIKPVDGSFTYTFDPDSLYSLTTTTGQGKGSAQPPPAAAFPLPYADDFENTPLTHTPRYLADQDGAFEVRPCVGHSGQCLEQVISTLPVPWSPVPLPFTLTGDSAWADYTVAADVRLLTDAPAALMGRIDSADVFKDSHALWPSAYVLQLKPDGVWELSSAQYKKPTVSLASGSTSLDPSQWHRLELRFHATTVTAVLDGRPLASVEDSTHTHGMFALGSGWNHVQFDNLTVTR